MPARIPGAATLGWRLAVAAAGALLLTGLATFQPASAQRPVHVQAALAASAPWLDRFNTWRAISGVPALTENTTWSAGDYAHGQYMVMNDLVTHYETPGTPYYTAAGDTAARSSNIYVSSTTATADTQAIDWWMGAPFHAMGMMDPRLTSTGFGAFRYVKSGWQLGAAVDVLRGNSFSGGQFPVLFPGNGTTEPLTTYSGNEFPDPLSACPGYSMPTGLPVFVEVGGNVATTITAHSFSVNGVQLAHCVIDSNNASLSSYLTSRGGAILIPQQPLVTGQTYKVGLTVNGVAYSWSFTVGPFSVCTVADSPAPVSPVNPGTTVTFTASATGCPSPLYQFWVMAPGASLYTLAQAYSTSATFTWNTTGLAAGTYAITVWARDASSLGTFGNSSGRWDGYRYLQYTLAVGCASVSDSPSPASPTVVGTTITFTASAAGCNPQYEFWILSPGAALYTLAQAYSSVNTFTWHTGSDGPGTYAVTVWAKDAGSAGGYGNSSGRWDAYSYLPYTMTPGCASVVDVAAPPSPSAHGTTVTFTSSATCPNPQYEFWILSPGASLYTLVQAYSSSNVLTWHTGSDGAGTYAVTVWVKDASSSGSYGNSSGRWDVYNYQQYSLS